MREMIFNEASLASSTWTVGLAKTALVDVANGMIALIQKMGLGQRLRMQHETTEVNVVDNETLYSLLVTLVQDPKTKAEARFWMGLATKTPLLRDLPADIKDRFLGCEPAMPDMSNADALVLCAIQSAIAISLPTDAAWGRDQLKIHFKEILLDGSEEDVCEIIDNLAGTKQADEIIARYKAQAFHQLTSATFWEKRAEIFPSLLFGLDVERQIANIGANQFATIMGCLHDLNISAKNWTKDAKLEWTRKVTAESKSVMDQSKLVDARKFKNRHDVTQLYEWHARYGSSGRIHLFADLENYTIEIGYIGQHLPL